MDALTPVQRDLFLFVREFLGKYHTIPSAAVVCDKFNRSSRAGAAKDLRLLASKGYLQKWELEARVANKLSKISGYRITQEAMSIQFTTNQPENAK